MYTYRQQPISIYLTSKTIYADDDIHSLQKGLYIQDQIELDKLVVIAGLRYDQYELMVHLMELL